MLRSTLLLATLAVTAAGCTTVGPVRPAVRADAEAPAWLSRLVDDAAPVVFFVGQRPKVRGGECRTFTYPVPTRSPASAPMQTAPKLHHDAPYQERLGVRGEPRVATGSTLAYVVGTDGKVREAAVVSQAGPADGSNAALMSMRQAQFEPARCDGQPIAVAYTLNLTNVQVATN